MIIESKVKYKGDYENIISMMGIGQIGAISLLHLFLKYPEANQIQTSGLFMNVFKPMGNR